MVIGFLIMTFKNIDQMTHFIIAALNLGGGGWKSACRDLVNKWPDAQGLEICFAFSAAASAIESNFNGNSPARELSNHAYRLAALIAADMFAMQSIGGYGTQARDLYKYWQDHDDYFLKL